MQEGLIQGGMSIQTVPSGAGAGVWLLRGRSWGEGIAGLQARCRWRSQSGSALPKKDSGTAGRGGAEGYDLVLRRRGNLHPFGETSAISAAT